MVCDRWMDGKMTYSPFQYMSQITLLSRECFFTSLWRAIKKSVKKTNKRVRDFRDLTANILKGVLNDIEVEPQLLSLTGGDLLYQTAIRGDEARLNIRA